MSEPSPNLPSDAPSTGPAPATGLARLFAAIVLALLAAAVFLPATDFQFSDLDVKEQVVDNEYIHELSPANVKHIFTSRCIKSYYPVRTLTFAIDYQLWGLNAGGFKVTNAIIHLANVWLVFAMLLRILAMRDGAQTISGVWWNVGLAALGAGIFAVHPVVVEPVVWAPGREELLMTLGALGCFHLHFSGRQLEQRGGNRWAVLGYRSAAALCCLMACLSNAVGAIIPALITAWDAVQDKTISVNTIRRTAALWLIGVITIVVKKVGAPQVATPASDVLSAKWLEVILNVYGANLRTLVWPRGLVAYYSWPTLGGFFSAGSLLGIAAAGVTCAVLWLARSRAMLLFGLLWFCVALAPVSGIMPHHIARADRFLYLPLIGACVAVAAALRAFVASRRVGRIAETSGIVGLIVILILAALSSGQVQYWRNPLTLWQHAVDVEPGNLFAESCLARNLAACDRPEEAQARYEVVVASPSVDADTLADFAWFLATRKDRENRDYARALQLSEIACRATEFKDARIIVKTAKVHCSYAEELAARGKTEPAIEHYRVAIAADPQFDVPLFNLALLLATCGDERFRKPEEAIPLAVRACELSKALTARQNIILAVAYGEAKRFDEALATLDKATERAKQEEDVPALEDLVGLRQVYAAGKSICSGGE